MCSFQHGSRVVNENFLIGLDTVQYRQDGIVRYSMGYSTRLCVLFDITGAAMCE